LLGTDDVVYYVYGFCLAMSPFHLYIYCVIM